MSNKNGKLATGIPWQICCKVSTLIRTHASNIRHEYAWLFVDCIYHDCQIYRSHIEKYIVNRRTRSKASFSSSCDAKRHSSWQWMRVGIPKLSSKSLAGVSAILSVHSFLSIDHHIVLEVSRIARGLILFSGPDCFPDVRNKIKGAKIKCTAMQDTHCRPKQVLQTTLTNVIIPVSHAHHPRAPNRHQAKCLRRRDGVLGGSEGDREAAGGVQLRAWTQQAHEGWL